MKKNMTMQMTFLMTMAIAAPSVARARSLSPTENTDRRAAETALRSAGVELMTVLGGSGEQRLAAIERARKNLRTAENITTTYVGFLATSKAAEGDPMSDLLCGIRTFRATLEMDSVGARSGLAMCRTFADGFDIAGKSLTQLVLEATPPPPPPPPQLIASQRFDCGPTCEVISTSAVVTGVVLVATAVGLLVASKATSDQRVEESNRYALTIARNDQLLNRSAAFETTALVVLPLGAIASTLGAFFLLRDEPSASAPETDAR